MNQRRSVDFIVGLFILAGIVSFSVLAFKVSGLSNYVAKEVFTVNAHFDNVGSLRARAPVTIAGVRVGEVTGIKLDSDTFKATVTINIQASEDSIPTDSSASILTEGLLGSNYIAITPGFDDEYLVDGGTIEETHQALILENLIGQLIFSIDKEDEKNKKDSKKEQ